MLDAGRPQHPVLFSQQLNLDLVWAALGLIAAVIAGVIVIVWVQRWQKRSADPGDPESELADYRDLLERGLLSREEFERIRMRYDGKPPPKPDPDLPMNGTPKPDHEPPPPGQGMP